MSIKAGTHEYVVVVSSSNLLIKCDKRT